MNMPVMNVRVMRMAVPDGEVRVPMTVLYGFESVKPMLMLMVLVMDVLVLMFQNIMQVFMVMMFSEVKPYTQPHKHRSNPECRRGRF